MLGVPRRQSTYVESGTFSTRISETNGSTLVGRIL